MSGKQLNDRQRRRLRRALGGALQEHRHITVRCKGCRTVLGKWVLATKMDGSRLVSFLPAGRLVPTRLASGLEGVATYRLDERGERVTDHSDEDGRLLGSVGPDGAIWASGERSAPPLLLDSHTVRGLTGDANDRERAEAEIAAARDVREGITQVLRIVCPRSNCRHPTLIDTDDL